MAVQWIEDAPFIDQSDWRWYGTNYDDYGYVDWQQIYWDNGIVTFTDIDQHQQYDWGLYLTQYDPSTGLTTGSIVYDNGAIVNF
jgi:hypothetical protein